MKILLVEDDNHLGESLRSALSHEGYVCDWVQRCDDALFAITSSAVDLIILDWSLPDGSGIDILRETRQQGIDTPTILLTARTHTGDKVTGLDAGADDYLAKPFDLEELFARLRSLSRRRAVKPTSLIKSGSLEIDPDSFEVRDSGTLIRLSRSEFQILRLLAEHEGQFISKSRIVETAYSWDTEITLNAIEAQISRIRRKLLSDRVTTLRGVGYRLEKGLK